MKISPAFLGFLRAIGVVVITSVLSYIGVAEHLAFLPSWVAALIAAGALALEHKIEDNSGKALFGAVRA